MSLVELARYESRVEADLARLTLERDGYDAVLFDSEMHGFLGVGWLFPVRLMVLAAEADEARAILKEDGLLPPG
ncbi:DUF2007 domain-containing protein [Sphingomonas sp. BN140010]|uniref:DUF2007 domain-containing protein n=1 Tax=Sphingomonas arvum TaxID=2992113 RepID=A0ABT3JFC4_9SPHN|nr:DUF2007 domain-containing protein [Sphingomonas sp. BN140010]MCW3797783.1 DUF2007 domain-containing protein [Sphingomonas sp. BN140010]